MRSPRPHQERALAFVRAHLAEGRRRPMVQLPTGAGKTFLAAMIARGALAKGRRVTFVVPAISLIDQTVAEFGREGIADIGVIQADHWMTDYDKPVQVASVQTLMARGIERVPPAHVVMIDEAHRHFDFTRDWMAHPDWQRVPFIGLSATPWQKGLGKSYDALVIGETCQGLIDKGFLSPFRVFAPAHPDLTGVKTDKGDYHEGQLAEVMSEGALVAGVVKTWLEKGESRPTLCFAVNRAHARKLQEEFQAAGVKCGYIDAHTPPAERREVQAQFERRETPVVVNIGCLTTGVDWDVRCVILARPTKSKMLYVQMVGRGLRTAPGKDSCLVLDHSDTTLRLGFVTDIHTDKLCDGKKRQGGDEREREEPLPKECPSCSFVKPPKSPECPNCGFKPQRQSEVVEVEGELAEVRGRRKYSMEEKQAWYSGLLWLARERNRNPGWAAHTYRSKFDVWPNQLRKEPLPPLPEVESYAVSQIIAHAHRRKVAP